MIADELKRQFYTHPAILACLPDIEAAVTTGTQPVAAAVQALLAAWRTETS
jgi:hypothetical protein